MSGEASTLFGWRLNYLLTVRRVSLRQLCRETGIDRSGFIKRRKRGQPTTSDVLHICRYFQISADWLLGLSDDMYGRIRWKGEKASGKAL